MKEKIEEGLTTKDVDEWVEREWLRPMGKVAKYLPTISMFLQTEIDYVYTGIKSYFGDAPCLNLLDAMVSITNIASDFEEADNQRAATECFEVVKSVITLLRTETDFDKQWIELFNSEDDWLVAHT